MTGSSVHRFESKILQMEMAVHTLCSVQCGGLCQVVNEVDYGRGRGFVDNS